MTPFQWISPAISSPKVMARSARGDKCSLCGMDRACDLDATAPGLAAKWVTKGLTMDLYIYISLYLGKNMVKELGFLHFFQQTNPLHLETFEHSSYRCCYTIT
jgi:hypothetical protein